jgi:hypothetical protein
MQQESSVIIASVPPSIAVFALVVAAVAVVFLAKKLLPREYRWEAMFRDLLADNLGDRK